MIVVIYVMRWPVPDFDSLLHTQTEHGTPKVTARLIGPGR
jgi:hypothetical protein